MVQIKILSGKKAGSSWDARHFPVRIGRAADCDLQLEETGVWDDHLELRVEPDGSVLLETHADAFASIEGQSVRSASLRNGDTIGIGSVKLQFWLSRARQRGQAFREAFVWTLIAGVWLAQIGLVYWLLTME
jgi:pSer/pThr/pTyr-binding forkhead associated (FHA) protein